MISDSQMYEEIMEVSDKICDEWEIDFLENIKSSVDADTLSGPRRAVLLRIYRKACDSQY